LSAEGGIPDPGANGIVARTGVGTTAGRQLTAGPGVQVERGDGQDGNPLINLDFDVVVRHSAGTADPIGSCAAGELYRQTTTGDIWVCPKGEEWVKIARGTHTHDAGEVMSGQFARERMGSGTANSTTFLRGDGAWAAPVTLVGTQERSIYLRPAQRNQIASANITNAVYDSGVLVSSLGGTLPEVTIRFPNATELWAWIAFLMPQDWNGGEVKVILHANNPVTAEQQYRMRVAVNCVTNGGTLGKDTTDAVGGTVTMASGTGPKTSYWNFNGVTARNCSAGLYGYVSIGRLGNDADDTSTQDAQIHGVELRYVSNQ
jgi:hypothetical protein